MAYISSIKHTAYLHAESLLKPSVRQETGLYLVESERLVLQALQVPNAVHSIYCTREQEETFLPACTKSETPLYTLGKGLLQRLTGTSYETVVTSFAVVHQKLLTEAEILSNSNGFILIGEHIQDPRNIGVLIRTAEAAGCSAVVLDKPSADLFSRAAVRSSTGSILRMPVHICSNLGELAQKMHANSFQIIASSAHAELPLYQAPLHHRPVAIMVGNESSGLSQQAYQQADCAVAIPMSSCGPSSLNVTVAAGILLFEIKKSVR